MSRTVTFLVLCVHVIFVGAFESFTMTSGYPNTPYLGFRHLITSVGTPDVVQELGTFRTSNPGIYFFTFTALSDLKGIRVSLRRNRVPVVTGFADDKGGYKTVTLNAVLRLVRGDAVYIYVEEGAIYESPLHAQRAFTSFSGYLVQAESRSGLFGLLGRSGNGTDFEVVEEVNEDNGMETDVKDSIFDRLAERNRQ